MKHAMTVDVEDYFQVAAFAPNIKYDEWEKWPMRVEQNTHAILDLFDKQGIQATFFVLGWVAERKPELVREIQKRGHEIACHGMTHQLVYSQKPEVFREETFRSKALLEDITGQAVNGYRAASYSITKQSLWALETLIDAGFTYDSSIFPVHHDRYGMPGAPLNIHTAITTAEKSITEFPLTSAQFMGRRLPVAGGGYFRIYPYWFTRSMLKRASEEIDQPFIFYLHPWEVDPNQPRIPGASALSRFRHYTNLKRCMPRLETLIKDFEFTTVQAVTDTYISNAPASGDAPVKSAMQQFDYRSLST
ncbi:polysaccharide deacetylase [Oleiphilus sp. HI0079]|uniref:XrtA system polysaccharide deacetylase n=1 Tax=Oleiphilus sp. HI0079 TaxID=1822254 RepID=UPI0007C27DDB|nr:XrtA system polysaccharide deacetylase [Oleiphilus sp. HI0079]KZZ15488.1 polysaccharide deacetylase [Oleiphilus sp. HI0079]